MGQWDVAFLDQHLTFQLNVTQFGEGGCWTPIHPILNPLLVAPEHPWSLLTFSSVALHFWKPPCDRLPPFLPWGGVPQMLPQRSKNHKTV